MSYVKQMSMTCVAALTIAVVYFYITSYYNKELYELSSSKIPSFLFRDGQKHQSGPVDLKNLKDVLNYRITQQNKVTNHVGNQSDVPCTFGLFRKYFKKNDYIPTGGNWVNINNLMRYQPNICKYKYTIQGNDFMARCFEKANLTHVVTTGDSNGGYNYNALVQLLNQLSCRRGRSDGGFTPKKQYYTFYNQSLAKFLRTKHRFCSSVCASRETFCKLSANDSKEIFLEQIASSLVLDDSVQLEIPRTEHFGDHLADNWALTNQEFYLRYFMKDRYPDILIVTMPFNHDKFITLERLEHDIRIFTWLVQYYVPPTTKVFYIPSFSEFEAKRKAATWVNRTFEGVLAAEKVKKNELSALLYPSR